MLNNLTTKFQEALMQAQQTAGRLGKPEISSLDVLVALLEQEGGILSPILRKASCDPGLLLQAAQREVSHEPTQSGATTQPQMGRDLATVMQAAEEERKKLKDDYLSVEHFMLGALDTQNKVHQLTDTFGLTKDNYLAAMKEVRGNQRVTDDNPEGKYQTLEKYGTDLTARARAGKIDPVIGRDTEIRRVLQILSRRTKNNPVLIGEPGVGKTAIAEGLARRIVNGDVPESMRNKRIVSLNIGSMLAGAKYRGEFEERLKSFLKEVTDSNGEIILFIDELHTIVGAGASEGAVDASNLLKPALARGELRTIGATTLDEYRKYIEKDAALERRFQPVMVSEPSVEDTIAILRGLKERYEVHHGVRITDAAIVAAATLSDRYISDRFLPDKAVDLVDEAAARLKIELDSMPTEIDQIEREAMQLEMERQALAEFLFDSENAIVRIDMSEYMEKHSVARLIGAPPGYVGYEEGGQLSEAVRRRPYCVVLFDEIEKAHPDVFNVLLQVLDDGRITDGQGRTVDFRNTVIIMTSNIGSQYILNEANAEQREAKALEALRGHFRPEFLNRIDEIIIFDRLTAQELKGIVDIQLQRVRRRLEAKGLFLRMTPEATALVADHGFDPVYGARPLKRAIQHDLLDPLSLKLLEGDFPEGTEIVVREKDGKLDFTKEKR